MRKRFMALCAVALVLLAACGAPATPAAQGTPAARQLRMAAVFPGTIADADYNTLGYVAIQAIQSELGIKIAYSENVAVPDVERVMREYVDQGFDIIWSHGSQFIQQTKTVAKANPKLSFIGEADAPDPEAPDNLWVLDRSFHLGFYPLGVIASKLTKSGKIGYLGGVSLPFSYAEYHAVEQALKETNAKVQFKAVWVGDFNDPAKARQAADAMIADGVDFIMGSLNLGIVGLTESVKSSGGKTLITVKYTDKSATAPNNIVTSVLYDFTPPLKEMVTKIRNGERKGYYEMGMGKGISIQLPLKNAPPELSKEIAKIVEDIKSGQIKVAEDATPVK